MKTNLLVNGTVIDADPLNENFTLAINTTALNVIRSLAAASIDWTDYGLGQFAINFNSDAMYRDYNKVDTTNTTAVVDCINGVAAAHTGLSLTGTDHNSAVPAPQYLWDLRLTAGPTNIPNQNDYVGKTFSSERVWQIVISADGSAGCSTWYIQKLDGSWTTVATHGISDTVYTDTVDATCTGIRIYNDDAGDDNL